MAVSDKNLRKNLTIDQKAEFTDGEWCVACSTALCGIKQHFDLTSRDSIRLGVLATVLLLENKESTLLLHCSARVVLRSCCMPQESTSRRSGEPAICCAAAFNAIDTDGSGKIDTAEVKQGLTMCGMVSCNCVYRLKCPLCSCRTDAVSLAAVRLILTCLM